MIIASKPFLNFNIFQVILVLKRCQIDEFIFTSVNPFFQITRQHPQDINATI